MVLCRIHKAVAIVRPPAFSPSSARAAGDPST